MLVINLILGGTKILHFGIYSDKLIFFNWSIVFYFLLKIEVNIEFF